MQRIAVALFTLFSSAFAQSQGGSMTYAPAALPAPPPTPIDMVQAVPIPALFLIPLGLILAVVGIRAVKRDGSAVLGALLAITGTFAVVSGGMVVQDAVATIAETELSDPNGAAITVPEGLHQYRNTSGVLLTITEITPPCPVGNTASNACIADGEIAIDGTCNTEYICTPPPEPEPEPEPEACADGDKDGICDDVDACPLDNPDDTDSDGVCDTNDACPLDNPDDTDADGICDTEDLCLGDNSSGDFDGDGICDNLDPPPEPEICDGIDNDLNTFVDDGLPSGIASGDVCAIENGAFSGTTYQCGFLTCQGAEGYSCVGSGSWYAGGSLSPSDAIVACEEDENNPRNPLPD